MYEKRNDNEKRKRKENVVAKVNIKHLQMILFAFGCVIDQKSCLIEKRDISMCVKTQAWNSTHENTLSIKTVKKMYVLPSRKDSTLYSGDTSSRESPLPFKGIFLEEQINPI